MKSIKLWIDDVRQMPSNFDLHARDAEEAIQMLRDYDITHVSFDHDLGQEASGYDIAAWVEMMAYTNELKRFTWQIHSANPVGASRIENAMKKADEFWERHG